MFLFQGASVVYKTIISPYFKKNQDKIDEALKSVDAAAAAAKKNVDQATN